MKVLIIKCGDSNLWYNRKVGNIYEVEKSFATNYRTKEGCIKKEDCEVIK
jgi:hypothetical protein